MVRRLRSWFAERWHECLLRSVFKCLYSQRQPDVYGELEENSAVKTGADYKQFKSNGGNGSATNFLLENFIGHNNAYSLYINGYWASESVQPGDGVLYEGKKALQSS